MLLPAWLAHTIVNDFLMFSIQAGVELGLTGVSESLSRLSCHGVCVCVCVCACVCASVCDGVCVRAVGRPCSSS